MYIPLQFTWQGSYLYSARYFDAKILQRDVAMDFCYEDQTVFLKMGLLTVWTLKITVMLGFLLYWHNVLSLLCDIIPTETINKEFCYKFWFLFAFIKFRPTLWSQATGIK